MKKILYITNIGSYGGAEQYFLDVIVGLARRGYNVEVYLVPESAAPGLEAFVRKLQDAKIVYSVVKRVTGVYSQIIDERCRDIAQRKPDLIHFNQGGPGCNRIEMAAAYRLSVPFVATSHDPSFEGRKAGRLKIMSLVEALYGWIYPWEADRYIVVSNTNRNLLTLNHRISPEKIDVIHLGLDIKSFRRPRNEEVLSAFGILPEHFVIGSVGALNWYKAQHIYIYAAAEMIANGAPENVRFILCGSGKREKELKELVRECKLDSRFLITGYIEHALIPDVLSRIDVFCLSSDIEGQPYALLEALAAGLPVVSTDVGGVADVIKDGVNGFVVPKGDYIALADKLRVLVENAQLCSQMGAAALRSVNERYRTERMIQETEMVYKKLLSEPIHRKGSVVQELIIQLLNRHPKIEILLKTGIRFWKKIIPRFGVLKFILSSIFSKRSFKIYKATEFIGGNKKGKYTFTFSRSAPYSTLYSSTYAVMTLSLFNKLNELSIKEKEEWASYIQSYQCDDGLFRDPAVDNEIAETEDWWGWRHLTCHALIALTAFRSVAKNRFKVLEPFYEDGFVKKWLEGKDWGERADFVSNEILNYGTLLQYARDFHNDKRAKNTLSEMYDWLDEHQEPKTGLWGPSPVNKHSLSIGVQTAYHIWLLYFYDERPIQYIERCIDGCLATQNKVGGFGVELNSSACEDIDSIDPLVRFHFLTNYRHDDIKKALTKAYKWVLINMNEDGGFVFRRGEPLRYGHKLLSSKADESAMFPTWFRTLSLAYLSKVINVPDLKKIGWNFVDCPGYQFWRDKPRD